MPPNSTRYKVHVPWADACTIIPEKKLIELAKTGVDKWRKNGVPSNRMIIPLAEFWNANHKRKIDLIIEEGEEVTRLLKAG